MTLDTQSLVWLLPICFIIHDFEEIVSWEAWMARNGAELVRRVPPALSSLANEFVKKSTAQVSLVVFLIFSVTATSAFLAATTGYYPLFLALMSMFFLHGFGHLGQAIILRRYVPGLVTSGLVVIPYGVFASVRVLSEHIVDLTALLEFYIAGVVLMLPFILLMHKAGDYLYPRAIRLLNL